MAKLEHNHKGHRQRLKKQMIESDLTSFASHNILETLLFYSIPQVDTNNIAHDLLNHFGSISGVLNATHDQLCSIIGIKDNTALLIKLISEITKRYWIEQENVAKQEVFDNISKIAGFLINKYIGYNQEQAFIMYLDDNLRMIACDRLAQGQVNSVNINKRELASKIIKYNATNIIISHNHPFSDTQPSSSDFASTMDLKKFLQAIDVNLIDHIIVSGRKFSSMKQLGLI